MQRPWTPWWSAEEGDLSYALGHYFQIPRTQARTCFLRPSLCAVLQREVCKWIFPILTVWSQITSLEAEYEL